MPPILMVNITLHVAGVFNNTLNCSPRVTASNHFPRNY